MSGTQNIPLAWVRESVHNVSTVTARCSPGCRHANPDTVTEMTNPRQQTRQPSGELFPSEHWMGAREAADALGISRLALYERALSGEIATVKVDGRRKFARADVLTAATTAAA
jgi:hypothetical protein